MIAICLGHLLPMDLPANALDMLRRFLYNQSFADTVLPNELSYILAMEEAANVQSSQGNGMAFAMLFLLVVLIAGGSLYLAANRSKASSSTLPYKNDVADEEVELMASGKTSMFPSLNFTSQSHQYKSIQ